MTGNPDTNPDNTPEPGLEQAGTGEFWADPGPGFTPESVPEPAGETVGQEVVEGWTPEKVVSVLQEIQAPAFNGGVNSLFGVKKVDWHHRQARLEAVAPSIAREWNKIDFVRSLAGETDRAIIASYLALEYVGPRAILIAAERREIARANQLAQQQQQAQPGMPAPIPEHEPAIRDEDPGEMPVENPGQAALADLPPRNRR